MKTTSCTGECFNPKNSDTYNLIDQDDYIDHELDETASNLDLSASVVAKRRLRKLNTSASKHAADDRSALRHGGIYRPPKGHQINSNSSTATASATTVLQTSSTTTIGGGGAASNNTQTTTAAATTAAATTTTSATTNCSRNNHHNCTCVSNTVAILSNRLLNGSLNLYYPNNQSKTKIIHHSNKNYQNQSHSNQ